MKFSILMPTYNDSDSIIETLDSVVNQKYGNWEMIIIDDGSTDDTKNIINNYVKNNDLQDKIIYIFQENGDQLDALLNGSSYIKGDYICILHSDDLLPDENFLFECNLVINDKYKDYDALSGDLIIINSESEETGTLQMRKYKQKYLFPILLLNYGSNMLNDLFIAKKDVYLKYIKEQYLIWNMSYWFYMHEGKPFLLNFQKVSFPIRKYRVHETNYLNSDIGKFNVVNGELRMLTNMLKNYYIPFFNIQHKIYRLFEKMNLTTLYIPLFFKREAKNKYSIVRRLIKITVGDIYINNAYLVAILGFFKSNIKRTIIIDKDIDESDIYYGKDMRVFNKKIIENNISSFYQTMFSEMVIGFDIVEVKTENQYKKIKTILTFLNISQFVEIEIKNR